MMLLTNSDYRLSVTYAFEGMIDFLLSELDYCVEDEYLTKVLSGDEEVSSFSELVNSFQSDAAYTLEAFLQNHDKNDFLKGRLSYYEYGTHKERGMGVELDHGMFYHITDAESIRYLMEALQTSDPATYLLESPTLSGFGGKDLEFNRSAMGSLTAFYKRVYKEAIKNNKRFSVCLDLDLTRKFLNSWYFPAPAL